MAHQQNKYNEWYGGTAMGLLKCGCYQVTGMGADILIDAGLCQEHAYEAGAKGVPIKTLEECANAIRVLALKQAEKP